MTPERWEQIKHLVNSALGESAEARTRLLQQSCADDFALRLGAEALLSATRQLPNMPLTPERWQRIEQLFQSALGFEADKRAAFLSQACAGDAELRREVESLLVYQGAAGGLIQDLIHEAAGWLPHDEKARFTPGTTLNKRYRILGLLGKGGMGEVYRADDLRLGQPVALKFLSEKLSQDKAMLARFHSEVAMAHRVTHPNVCRVHDIGEVITSSGTLQFLSMEYVDGEDLSSLLRRIGRLPSDKAVEIANQLCAGLAAAHEAGVLHRDLKPANVMIDGKGRVRITDFGLAGFAEQIKGNEVMAGTPAYMSPEQFAGKEVTTKSDIYALGLVLYEIFTGKRVFEAGSLDELRQMHTSSAPTTPSSWVKDLDPLVERVILRCLEKDPGRRLASAKQVADALPGGDPLAAALAMGETPSPEVVAAAGSKIGMKPIYAVACLLAIVTGLIIAAMLGKQAYFVPQVMRENSPDALAHKARDIIRRIGYTDQRISNASGLRYHFSYLNYGMEKVKPADRWGQLRQGRPPSIVFWYRESPRYLVGQFPESGGQVLDYDPPADVSGMVSVRLDPQGRLLLFEAVPPQLDKSSGIPPSPEWATLFEEAGLDLSHFTSAEPQWTSLAPCDVRAAWIETQPAQPDFALRVEAAAFRGKPVYFHLIWPWARPGRMQEYQAPIGQRISDAIGIVLFLALLIGAVLIARHNFRLGRGDRRGAFRLAIFAFSLVMLKWVFGAGHEPTLNETNNFLAMGVGPALAFAGFVWLFYIALEPYARRRWSVTLISWSRLLSGGLRDPLVGRDLLVGTLFGVGLGLLDVLRSLINIRLGTMIPNGEENFLDVLFGTRWFLVRGLWVNLLLSISFALFLFFLLVLLRALTRRAWLAAVIFVLICIIVNVLPASNPWVAALYAGLAWSLMVTVLLRFGLLASAVSYFVWSLFVIPITADFSAWYISTSLSVVLVILALAVYAFRTSLGGQKVFTEQLLEE